METNNAAGGGGHRVRVVKYMECRRNLAAQPGGHAFDGCPEFAKSGVVGTPGSLFCATCGCNRKFHRKEELPGYPTDNIPLHCLAAAAVAAAAPLPPLPPRPPRPPRPAVAPAMPPPPPRQPLVVPPAPSNQPPNYSGSDTFPGWEIGEETKPPKKRRTNTDAGESSTGV